MHFSHSKHLRLALTAVFLFKKKMNTECSSDRKHKRQKLQIHELGSVSQPF